MTTFGVRVTRLMMRDGVTQQNLADAMGVTQTAVSYWCADKREPDFAMLCRIADRFGVTTDHLLGHELPETTDAVELTRRVAGRLKAAADELVTLVGPLWNERDGLRSAAPDAQRQA